MLRQLKNVSIFLLIITVSSLGACAPRYISAEIELDPTRAVRDAAPNCYDEIIAINEYEALPTEVCVNAIKCEQDNAVYWEKRYFVLRSQVEAMESAQ